MPKIDKSSFAMQVFAATDIDAVELAMNRVKLYSHCKVLHTAKSSLYAIQCIVAIHKSAHCCHYAVRVFSFENRLGVQGALMLSFAACKAQEAQDALHIAAEQYSAHADTEVTPDTPLWSMQLCSNNVLPSSARSTFVLPHIGSADSGGC